MKCPYCDEEMKKGSIPNECHPYWLPEGKRTPLIRMIVPKSAVRLVLGESSALWQEATAWYCPDCKIVIAHTEK